LIIWKINVLLFVKKPITVTPVSRKNNFHFLIYLLFAHFHNHEITKDIPSARTYPISVRQTHRFEPNLVGVNENVSFSKKIKLNPVKSFRIGKVCGKIEG